MTFHQNQVSGSLSVMCAEQYEWNRRWCLVGGRSWRKFFA